MPIPPDYTLEVAEDMHPSDFTLTYHSTEKIHLPVREVKITIGENLVPEVWVRIGRVELKTRQPK